MKNIYTKAAAIMLVGALTAGIAYGGTKGGLLFAEENANEVSESENQSASEGVTAESAALPEGAGETGAGETPAEMGALPAVPEVLPDMGIPEVPGDLTAPAQPVLDAGLPGDILQEPEAPETAESPASPEAEASEVAGGETGTTVGKETAKQVPDETGAPVPEAPANTGTNPAAQNPGGSPVTVAAEAESVPAAPLQILPQTPVGLPGAAVGAQNPDAKDVGVKISEEDKNNFGEITAEATELETDGAHLNVRTSDGDKIKPWISVDQSLSYQSMKTFDLSLSDTVGNLISDDSFGTCTVTFELPANMDISKGSVRIVAVKDGKLEYLRSSTKTVDGKQYVTFSTDHFSQYAMLYSGQNQKPGGSGGSSSGGSSSGSSSVPAASDSSASAQTAAQVIPGILPQVPQSYAVATTVLPQITLAPVTPAVQTKQAGTARKLDQLPKTGED